MTMVLEISSFVGGDEVRGGTSFDFVRPQDERLVGRIVEAGAEGVEAAVQVAATAFRARKSAVHQRIEWLKSAAVALAAEADEVAQIICEDVGKPIRSCRFEVRRHRQTGTCGRTYSCEIGSSVPGGEVAQGSFTVATGDKLTAAELVAHPEVRAVSFMGGTSGGDALARAAGAKKFVAELGSNAANIVLADADLDDAAKRIASAAFEASGQQCISAQRILVDRRSLDSFLAKFVNSAKALKVGRADDPMTDIGRMVSRASADA